MTTQLNYINLIRDRHSTRRYVQHPLTIIDQRQIQEAIATAVPLQGTRLLEWKLAERSPMGCSTVLFAESGMSADELVEYGYQGQQIVLTLFAQDWGTCWYGSLRLPGSPCSIAIGKTADGKGLRSTFMSAIVRGNVRKPMEQLIPEGIPENSAPQVRTVLASARLAPSARNRQPWTFEVVSNSSIIIHGDTDHFLDLGICLANAMVTARQLAGTTTVTRLKPDEYSVSW